MSEWIIIYPVQQSRDIIHKHHGNIVTFIDLLLRDCEYMGFKSALSDATHGGTYAYEGATRTQVVQVNNCDFRKSQILEFLSDSLF